MAEDVDGGLKVDDHARAASGVGGVRPWVAVPTGQLIHQNVGVEFRKPVRSDVRNPQNGEQTEHSRDQESLQRALPIDSAASKNSTRPGLRRGLDGEANRQT